MNASADDLELDFLLNNLESERSFELSGPLLQWLMLNQYDVGKADSYENVLSETPKLSSNMPADAALVVEKRDVTAVIYFILSESHLDLSQRVKQLTNEFHDQDEPERTFSQQSPRLRSIFKPALIRDGVSLARTIVCVCTKNLTDAQAKRVVRSSLHIPTTVDVFDLNFLRALAKAESSPRTPDVKISVDNSNILDLGIPDTPGVAFTISAMDIASWTGIEDRSLFDLNVRHTLGINKVRKSLDSALTDTQNASEFIAYHNGITAVCDDFSINENNLTVTGLSIVNGAQSVVAIHANRDKLASGIKILFKLVKADINSELSRNIAIRSNTQNPVTSRNLRALDPVQERLVRDVGTLGYVYNTRPESATLTNSKIIQNDDVAQLLCSIYSRNPALAIKRQLLFESPLYHHIFPEDLPAERVVFAHIVRRAVETAREMVPALYQSAWALTSLTMVYMVGEAMRADRAFARILLYPLDAVADIEQLQHDMKPFVNSACEVLQARESNFKSDRSRELDDFKVAFKQTRTLSELGASAARILVESTRSADL